jgi:hypothetical protein
MSTHATRLAELESARDSERDKMLAAKREKNLSTAPLLKDRLERKRKAAALCYRRLGLAIEREKKQITSTKLEEA